MPIGGRIEGGAGADASIWTVEYEVDFAQHFASTGTHDFKADATEPINLVTWTAENAAASDKFAISAAGLEIDPSNSAAHLWTTTQSLPYLAAKLTDMVAGLSEDDTVALQLYMDSSPAPSADFDAYGMALWNGVATPNNKFLALRYYHGGGNNYSIAFVENGTGYDQLTKAAAQTFFEVVLYPGNGAAARVGVFDTEFPDPLTTGDLDSFASLSGNLGPGGGGGTAIPSWSIPKATASFMIFAQRQSSATVLTTTAYKMRVLRRRKA